MYPFHIDPELKREKRMSTQEVFIVFWDYARPEMREVSCFIFPAELKISAGYLKHHSDQGVTPAKFFDHMNMQDRMITRDQTVIQDLADILKMPIKVFVCSGYERVPYQIFFCTPSA